jgi:uncharacterized membrane protein YdjX (TVP38/TMEM64 family)
MKNKKVIFFVLLFLVIGINYYVSSMNLLTLESIKANRDILITYVGNHLILSVLAFSIIYILATSLSVPGAALLSLTGGLLFPFPLSGIVVLTSATIGAFINFLVSRYLLKDFIKRKFEKPMAKINKELEKNGNNYLLTLRLIPLFPFFLINLAMGLTDMPAIKFMVISYIGMAPGSLVYVYAGRNLATIEQTKDIFSPSVIIAFTLLGLFSLLPAVYDKIKKNR